MKAYNMKLNPAKCAFGVSIGKFLGFIVTQRGIKVNPEQIKAVMETFPPSSKKEMQRLIGRLTVLGRFIARFTNKLRHWTKCQIRTLSKLGQKGSEPYHFRCLLSSVLLHRISTLKCRLQSAMGGANHPSKARVAEQLNKMMTGEGKKGIYAWYWRLGRNKARNYL